MTLRLDAEDQPVCPVAEMTLRGAHNLENVLAATACAGALGVPPARLRAAIRVFRAVAHRLQWVRNRAGVAYYNDSKGTNVDATLKALAAFSEPIVLIAGGRDKGQRFDALAAAARGRVKGAVLIGEGRRDLGPRAPGGDARRGGGLHGRRGAARRRARGAGGRGLAVAGLRLVRPLPGLRAPR